MRDDRWKIDTQPLVRRTAEDWRPEGFKRPTTADRVWIWVWVAVLLGSIVWVSVHVLGER